MGSGSVTSHGKGKSHEFKVKEAKKIVDYLKPSRKTSSSNLSSNVAPKGLDTNTIQFVCTTHCSGDSGEANSVRKLDGHWNVLSGYSNNSCQDTFSYLKVCFLTVKLLKKMELCPNKLKYLVNHGLAPYFKGCLSDDILKSEYKILKFYSNFWWKPELYC